VNTEYQTGKRESCQRDIMRDKISSDMREKNFGA